MGLGCALIIFEHFSDTPWVMKNSKALKTNYVLVDYENVQPKNLSLLTQDYFQIYLFLGVKQNRLSLELVEAMHNFGPDRSKYIYVTKTGANALDFHITYYLGKLATKNPNACFHIISKDKGFDPLIKHLNTIKVNASRRESIAHIPALSVKKNSKSSVSKNSKSSVNKNSKSEEKINVIVKNLKGRGKAKPRKEKTLKNTIKNIFQQKLTESEVNAVFNKLAKSKYITSKNGNISYLLPK